MKFRPILPCLLLALCCLPSCSTTDGQPRRVGISQGSGLPQSLIGAAVGGFIGSLTDNTDENGNNNGNNSLFGSTANNGTISGAGTTAAGTTAGTTAGTGANTGNGLLNGAATTLGLNNTQTQPTFYDRHRGAITGAASGLAAGLIAQQMTKGESEQMYAHGYAKAKSDAIKDFYWLQRDASRPKEGEVSVQRRYYEVPVPAHVTSDGVRIEPHRRVVEIVE